jgi:hypothetical protein
LRGGVFPGHSYHHVPPCFWARRQLDPWAGIHRTFCALRHPHSRAISAFVFRHERSGLPDAQYCRAEALNTYVIERMRTMTRRQDDVERCELDHELGRDDCHWLPQSMFAARCDTLLDYENLQQEFRTLSTELARSGLMAHPFDLPHGGPRVHATTCHLGVEMLNATALALLDRVYAEDLRRYEALHN